MAHKGSRKASEPLITTQHTTDHKNRRKSAPSIRRKHGVHSLDEQLMEDDAVSEELSSSEEAQKISDSDLQQQGKKSTSTQWLNNYLHNRKHRQYPGAPMSHSLDQYTEGRCRKNIMRNNYWSYDESSMGFDEGDRPVIDSRGTANSIEVSNHKDQPHRRHPWTTQKLRKISDNLFQRKKSGSIKFEMEMGALENNPCKSSGTPSVQGDCIQPVWSFDMSSDNQDEPQRRKENMLKKLGDSILQPVTNRMRVCGSSKTSPGHNEDNFDDIYEKSERKNQYFQDGEDTSLILGGGDLSGDEDAVVGDLLFRPEDDDDDGWDDGEHNDNNGGTSDHRSSQEDSSNVIMSSEDTISHIRDSMENGESMFEIDESDDERKSYVHQMTSFLKGKLPFTIDAESKCNKKRKGFSRHPEDEVKQIAVTFIEEKDVMITEANEQDDEKMINDNDDDLDDKSSLVSSFNRLKVKGRNPKLRKRSLSDGVILEGNIRKA